MTLRSLRSPRSGIRATTLMAALAMAVAAIPCADAARLTHSRVVSAQDAPLQVLVGLADLTAAERDSLQVRIADAASWQRAGLKPPVPLETLSLRVEPGADPTRRSLRLTSTEPARDPAVDILLDMSTSAGQRQLQVTVMQTRQGFPGLLAAPGVNAPGGSTRGSAAPGAGLATSTNVRQGDTLFGIARSNAVADASVYQMLVALWQANPQAFIQNNMNRLRAGATLTIPDAATVRAVDPADARRIFLEQAEAYARYRAGLAGAAARSTAATGTPAASGRVGSGEAAARGAAAAQDRLRLSAANAAQGDAQARGDAAVSQSLAARDAQGRLQELQRNVDDLSAATARAEQGGAGGEGGALAAAAGAAGAGAQARGGAGTTAPGFDRAGATGQGAAGHGEAGAVAGGGAPDAVAGAAQPDAEPGTSGQATAGRGKAGQGASGQTATQPGVVAAGSATAGPTAAVRGAASDGAGASDRASGTANGLLDPDVQAGSEADRTPGSGLPAWLSDNLLMIASVVLALIVFVIAWLLRRAGTRRADDLDELDGLDGDAPAGRIDPRAIDERLDGIDLDLDQPPADSGYGATRPPGADTRRP